MFNISFEKIKDYFPQISAIIFFLSVTKLVYFYKYYGVDIISFLTVGEVIKSSLDTIMVVVVIMTLPLMMEESIFDNEQIRKNFVEELGERNKKKAKDPINTFLGWCLGVGAINIIVNISSFGFAHWLREHPLAVMISFPIVITLNAIAANYTQNIRPFYNVIDDNIKERITSAYKVYNIFTCLFAFTFVIFYTLMDAQLSKRSTDVSFKINDKSIQSDRHNLYVGSTENYLVMFNDSLDRASMYRKEDISELTFQKRER